MTDPVRVLILVSAPLVAKHESGMTSPGPALNWRAELNEILKAIQGPHGKRQIACEVSLHFASTETFLRTLSTLPQSVDILHFIGHGQLQNPRSSELVLEDRSGNTQTFSVEALTQTLATNDQQAVCQVAFLSTCHSAQLGQTLAQARVKHVIAIDLEHGVYSDTTRQFASFFYDALFAGRSVRSAFRTAQNAVRNSHEPRTGSQTPQQEAKKFKLLPAGFRASVSLQHQRKPFKHTPTGDTQTQTPWEGERAQTTNLTPNSGRPFVAREHDMHTALHKLMGTTTAGTEQRFVHISGAPGIGKSALADALARWYHERSSLAQN